MLVDDLRRTKEILITDGWCKHVAHLPSGEHCIHGAIARVVESDYTYSRERIDAMMRALEKTVGVGPCELPSKWNDRHTTTFDKVIAVLDKAICAQTLSSKPESISTSSMEKNTLQLQPS
jgi:hypothetical protein